MPRLIGDEARKNSSPGRRFGINRGRIHLLRLESGSRDTMQLSIKSRARGFDLGQLHV